MNEYVGSMPVRVLCWYQDVKRKWPWRETTDPYKILVSEFMLQQTQCSRVQEKYIQFLEKFPTVYALGQALLNDVLLMWEGLGYYTRARNLHASAQAIVEGYYSFPSTKKALQQLPGVGEYTASAVASIAFGENVAAVDVNVIRVFSRYFGVEYVRSKAVSTAKKWIQCGKIECGDAWNPGAFNQGMMELGQTLCVRFPQKELCRKCPLYDGCASKGSLFSYPLPRIRSTQIPRKVVDLYLVVYDDAVYLHKSRKDLWEVPEKSRFVMFSKGTFLGEFRHTRGGIRYKYRVFQHNVSCFAHGTEDGSLIPIDDLHSIAMQTWCRKALSFLEKYHA